jgi:hypothetical protein
MAIATSYWASDLDAMIEDLPATFVLGALSFDCSISELTQDQMLLLTGFNGIDGLRVVFPVSAVASASTPLTPQKRVGVRRPGDAAARNYAIVMVEKPADNVAYTLVLKDDHRT